MAQEGAARPPVRLIVASLVGAAVAVMLGVYDRNHAGSAKTFPLWFSGQLQMKTWLATLAVLFALFQVLSALRIYGRVKIPKQQPKWLGDAHRLSGTLAFLCSLPVAYHCLWSIGSRGLGSGRVVVHAVAGSLFYGVFATKMLIVRDRSTPGWALPLVGGLAFTALVVIWFTSAYWFLTTTNGSIF